MIYKDELELIVKNPNQKFSVQWFLDEGGSNVETIKDVYLRIHKIKKDSHFPEQPFIITALNAYGENLDTFVNASGLGRMGGSGFKMLHSITPL